MDHKGKHPAPEGQDPEPKRVRFSKTMTLEDVVADLIETFVARNELLSSYDNPQTHNMGTRVAHLIKENLFECKDYNTWLLLVQQLGKALAQNTDKYKHLETFERNKRFLKDEANELENGWWGLGNPGEEPKNSYRMCREWLTVLTYLNPNIKPEDMLEVAQSISSSYDKLEWTPDDYPLQMVGGTGYPLPMYERQRRSFWFAMLFAQIYDPRAEEYWPYNPAIIQDAKHVLDHFHRPKDDDKDKETHELKLKELENLEAEQAELKDFDKNDATFFEGCLPIEELARRGEDTYRVRPCEHCAARCRHSTANA